MHVRDQDLHKSRLIKSSDCSRLNLKRISLLNAVDLLTLGRNQMETIGSIGAECPPLG